MVEAQHERETSSKCKDSLQLYGGEPVEEEEEEEDIMAAMCHSGECFDVIQPNGLDEAYYKELNQ